VVLLQYWLPSRAAMAYRSLRDDTLDADGQACAAVATRPIVLPDDHLDANEYAARWWYRATLVTFVALMIITVVVPRSGVPYVLLAILCVDMGVVLQLQRRLRASKKLVDRGVDVMPRRHAAKSRDFWIGAALGICVFALVLVATVPT